MGETAARMLMGYFDGTPLPAEPRSVLPTTLIVRGSTAPNA